MSNFFFRAVAHIKTVLTHKKLVHELAKMAGIEHQGITHDLSKFSPTELFESIKYYTDGKQSPILACKKAKGYSRAWAHHIKHNKHHLEYWVDEDVRFGAKLMPYKYWAELICDNLAAGMTYKKGKWKKSYQLEYWQKSIKDWKSKPHHYVHPAIEAATTKVFSEIAEKGFLSVITAEHLQDVYYEEVKKVQIK